MSDWSKPENPAALGLPVVPAEEVGGFRIQRPGPPDDGYHLDLLIMRKSIRLVETPADWRLRWWAYEGSSLLTFVRAVGEGMLWNRETNNPAGWSVAWDGPRQPDLRDLAKGRP